MEETDLLMEHVYFDEGNYLREQVKKESQSLFLKWIELGESIIGTDAEKEHTYSFWNRLATLYRVNNQSSKAVFFFKKALNLPECQKSTFEIVTRIRLGEALKYDNKLIQALGEFKKVELLIESSTSDQYKDFMLQHKGKCVMEMGYLKEAEKCFSQALHIRKQKGNEELIASTEKALHFVREKLKK
jgi:tetratricopeptide (TPR) repeat protein